MFAGHSMLPPQHAKSGALGAPVLCPYQETTGARKRAAVRVPFAFALAGVVLALLVGCHHKKTSTTAPTTPVTPTGVTSMTILGNATDASGNPLGTSRSLQVTLDVVTQ
jgi:hypothetical protein